MTSTIDDLFEKIIHSEKAAQNRKNYLNELKQQLQLSAQKVNAECRTLQDQLAQKLQEFSKEELKAKWLTSQQAIYKQQRDEYKDRIDAVKTKLKALKTDLTNEKKSFCNEMEKFSLTFDLSGRGQIQREVEYKQQLQALSKEEAQLKQELQKYAEQKAVIDALIGQKKTLQQTLKMLNEKNANLELELHKEIQKTSQLEAQKVSVSNYVQTDPEFCSLERELCEARRICPEDACSRLQEEYQHLQHALWQKHVHARQQQQQQQQRKQEEEYSSEVLSEMFDDSNDIVDSDNAMDSQGNSVVAQAGSQTEQSQRKRKIFRPKKPQLLQSDIETKHQ